MRHRRLWPYRLIGSPPKPPLVFLHGYLGSGEDWLQVAEQCAAQFLCILPDLPGHGQNTHQPFTQPLSFEVIAEGLVTLIEALGLDRVGLVGYSMGGRIALYSALRRPQQISALVLESCSPGLATGQARRQRARVDDRRAKSILAGGLEAFVDHWYDMELFGTLKSQPCLFQEIREKRKMNDREWAAKVISELSPGRQPSLWPELGGLRLPTLLLAGALDSNYVEIIAAMDQKIPKSKVEIVPEAGHNIHLEHPSRFIKLVVDFLRESPLFLSNS